jgi:prepilin-type N-terminal cleavage/methylation domain-containing protein
MITIKTIRRWKLSPGKSPLPFTEERRTSRLRGGFTLVELLVSMGILSVFVVLLTQMLGQTGTAWVAGQAQTERRVTARALSDTIARQLQTALSPLDPADQTTLQFILNPASVPVTYQNPDALFWQAPVATDASRGNVAEVGYFLKWDVTQKTQPHPLLCQFFVNPTDPNFLIYKQPTTWLNSMILDTVAPANNLSNNAYRGLFAENVLGFWVRCYDQTGTLFPPSVQNENQYDSRVHGAVPFKPALPRSVKISMVLADPRALVRLTQVPDYTKAGTADPPDLDSFIAALPNGIRQTAQPYTTEIYLENSL